MKTSTLFTAALIALGTHSAFSAAMARERGEAPRREDPRSIVGDDRGGSADRTRRTEAGDDLDNRSLERSEDRIGRDANYQDGR